MKYKVGDRVKIIAPEHSVAVFEGCIGKVADVIFEDDAKKVIKHYVISVNFEVSDEPINCIFFPPELKIVKDA